MPALQIVIIVSCTELVSLLGSVILHALHGGHFLVNALGIGDGAGGDAHEHLADGGIEERDQVAEIQQRKIISHNKF